MSFLLSLLSCSYPSGNQRLTHVADLMDSSPDSSLLILNGLLKDEVKMSKSDKMKMKLLYAIAMNKTFRQMDTISYMPKVLEFYQSKGTDE